MFFFDSGEPILRGLRLSNGPFDQQCFFASFRGASDRRGAHPHAGKAGAQLIVRSLTPGDRAPSMFRQTECQLLGARRSSDAPRSDTLRTLTVGIIAATYLSPRALM